MSAYSFTSLDVGFDLRTHGTPIVLPPDATAVRYQTRAGNEREVCGDRATIILTLRANGYRVAADPLPPLATTGPWTGVPLQRARLAAGMSRSDLARRVATEPGCERVSPETVACNEPGPRGGKAPNATLLGAYARALGVTTDALLAVEADVERDPDPTIEVSRESLGLPRRE